ncbi:MAG: DNA polymerase III subunit delta [Candidatus Omnitrophota bacterium]|nr:DNA polymerase III subunit delta [Candidatus Omnitrophota bacterium]
MPTKELTSYLFLGEEDFLKETELKKLKSRFLENSTRDLNYNVFYAKDKDFKLKEALDILNTTPFVSPKRFVILKDTDSLSASDKESVLFYLKNPKESSIFIIDSKSSKIKEGFMLEASKLTKLIRSDRLMDSEINAWILKRTLAAGKKISVEAVNLIKENLPNDLNILCSSVDTLILYAGKRPDITKQDVEKIIYVAPLKTSFDLLDAIEKKDVKKAMNIFASIQKYKRRETELLLGLLSWQFRMLLRVKELLKIRNKPEIQKELNLYSSKFDQIARYAARFKRQEIVRVLDEILKADSDIKTGESLPKFALEKLIFKMCL